MKKLIKIFLFVEMFLFVSIPIGVTIFLVTLIAAKCIGKRNYFTVELKSILYLTLLLCHIVKIFRVIRSCQVYIINLYFTFESM